MVGGRLKSVPKRKRELKKGLVQINCKAHASEWRWRAERACQWSMGLHAWEQYPLAIREVGSEQGWGGSQRRACAWLCRPVAEGGGKRRANWVRTARGAAVFKGRLRAAGWGGPEGDEGYSVPTHLASPYT